MIIRKNSKTLFWIVDVRCKDIFFIEVMRRQEKRGKLMVLAAATVGTALLGWTFMVRQCYPELVIFRQCYPNPVIDRQCHPKPVIHRQCLLATQWLEVRSPLGR